MGADPQLDEELAALLEQLVPDPKRGLTIETPIKLHGYGRVAWFRDAGTVGIWLPIDPFDVANVKSWLAKHRVEPVVIQLSAPDDEKLFGALATARCTACAGKLEYLDPRLHDIESPQLVCRPCGGFYDVATFT